MISKSKFENHEICRVIMNNKSIFQNEIDKNLKPHLYACQQQFAADQVSCQSKHQIAQTSNSEESFVNFSSKIGYKLHEINEVQCRNITACDKVTSSASKHKVMPQKWSTYCHNQNQTSFFVIFGINFQFWSSLTLLYVRWRRQ